MVFKQFERFTWKLAQNANRINYNREIFCLVSKSHQRVSEEELKNTKKDMGKPWELNE